MFRASNKSSGVLHSNQECNLNVHSHGLFVACVHAISVAPKTNNTKTVYKSANKRGGELRKSHINYTIGFEIKE